MKRVLLFSLMAFSVQSFASQGWKIVAIVSDPACSEKIQILAKDGENFVYAVSGTEKNKLMADDGSAFQADSMKSTTFSSSSYIFTHPSYVEGNPPKIDIIKSSTKKNCLMNLK
jgi:hypothetical protein